ncbi:formate dehydrogenase subunit alpha [Campylobacterota bacterium]|nr:formate dehydrogenase subunit alpha [Campylobacterota bacterium]
MIQTRRGVCAYCGVGCEIIARVENETILSIEGDPNGAVSRGKLCVKGRYGFDFASSPSRVIGARIKRSFVAKNSAKMPQNLRSKLFLLTPLDEGFFSLPIDIAIEIAAWKSGEILQVSGGGAFGFVGGARTSCENAYYFQKFAREFIKSPNIDNCARVCHAPSLAGLRRVLGEGAASVPFDDIFKAELIVVIGSNTTEAHPIVGLRILEAVRGGGVNGEKAKLAVIDTRRVTIGKNADYEIIAPFESNLAILNAIAKYIVENDLCDLAFLADRTSGFEDYKAKILCEKSVDFSAIEGGGAIADQIAKLAQEIAAKKTIFVWGLGVTEHIDGSDSVSAIANIALLTGNIGREGAGVMPLRGQNNVQGACDMGCLPYFETGYKTPTAIGLKTPEMIDAIFEGKIRAIFNVGEDIAHVHSDISRVETALAKLDFLCVCELFMSGVARMADIVIGVKSAYERGGVYINAERRAHLTKPLIKTDAIEEYEFFAALKNAMSGSHDRVTPHDIWREVCERSGDYFGDLSYENLERSSGILWKGDRLYENGFHFEDKKARFFYAPPRETTQKHEKQGIFWLSTGRILTQYNNAAQTSETPRLNSKYEEDAALISPLDAVYFDLTKRYFLQSRYGKSTPLRLKIDEGIQKGAVFCTFHHARSGINRLFGGECDPLTKTPRFKAIEVEIKAGE